MSPAIGVALLPQGRERAASAAVGTGNETKLANGDLYEGEMQDGKPHGKGKLIRKKKGLFAGKVGFCFFSCSLRLAMRVSPHPAP